MTGASVRRYWPWLFLGCAAILNVLQLIATPYSSIWSADLIKKQLASGSREFASTALGNCRMQMDYLSEKLGGTTNSAQPEIILGGVNPVFLVELILLVTAFLIVLLVHHKSRNVEPVGSLPFSWRQAALIGVLLFIVDQARYTMTSVFIIKKNFYTWSSYCFQGDLGWVVDAIAYVPLYAALGATVATFLHILGRITPENANLSHNSLGLEAEHEALTGTLAWTSGISLSFFAIWVLGTGIGISASVFYAGQAVFVFAIIGLLFLFSGYRCYRLVQWYQSEFEHARKNIAEQEGRDPREIPDDSVHGSGIAKNPFQDVLGDHGMNFAKNLASVFGPVIGYLSITVEGFDKVKDVLKALG